MRSEIYNCTFKNTNKVSIIIIIIIIIIIVIIIIAETWRCTELVNDIHRKDLQ